MSDFKETLQRVKDMIKPLLVREDSTPEEISSYGNLEKDLDSLQTQHDVVIGVNATLQESILHVVKNQGSGDKPQDGNDGSNPKSIEECIAEIQKEAK